MKNNLLIFFFLFLISSSVSIADEFRFETSEIKLIDGGKLVYAKNGLAISSNNNIEINAENFKYNKETQKLKATKGIILFKSENLEIEFGELSHNQVSLITIAENGVKIIDKNKKFFVTTDSVIFNKRNNISKSDSKSTLKDELKNELQAESFLYDINDGILKLKNTNLKDLNGNNFNMEFAFLNTNTKQLIGNDIVVNLNNKSFDKDNEPRIKGKTLVYDNEKTEITKGVFTTCKKTDKCPP